MNVNNNQAYQRKNREIHKMVVRYNKHYSFPYLEQELPLIKFDHVTYHHPGSNETDPPALNDIDITIEAGEWVAVVGANGSGKSTFARHCNALLLPSEGQVVINGKETSRATHLPEIRARIGMVFQNPEDQIVATIIEEDTAFGPENLAIKSSEIRERVFNALGRVKMLDEKERPPHLLSAGQKQRVALAGVLAMQPECIIFDESTAMLDPRGRQDVMAEMQSLHKRGTTVLFITHFMEEVLRAQRVLVLNQGSLVFDGAPNTLFADLPLLKRCGLEQPISIQLITEMRKASPQLAGIPNDFEQMLLEIPDYSGTAQLQGEDACAQAGEVLIHIDHLNHIYMPGTPLEHQALFDINFDVTKGEAHGLVGATGSGKSTLLQHLNGLYRPQSGEVRVGPFSYSDPKLDVKAIRRYAGLVFQNPEIYFFEQYVGDEISYGPRMLYGREGLRERVQQAMEMVGLDFEKFKDRVTYTLSGGEKRKVALAATLAAQPSLLILDEPTAGLDPLSRYNLQNTLKEAQHKGIELIISSHSMGDITELTQNMTLMADGRAIGTGNTAELFNDEDLVTAAGLGQPAVVRLTKVMRAKGWPIPARTVTVKQLLSAIRNAEGGAA